MLNRVLAKAELHAILPLIALAAPRWVNEHHVLDQLMNELHVIRTVSVRIEHVKQAQIP